MNPTDDQRIAELAIGFALGELAEEELRELYDCLRQDGEAGRQAAKVAWDTLGTTMDLRAQMGSTFQDTLRHRIGSTDEASDGGFTRGLWSRLRMSRPRLQPVKVPALHVPESPWRLASGVVVAVATVLVLVVLAGRSRSQTAASVAGIEGPASVAGESLADGVGIPGGAWLVVPTGSQVTVAWRDGTMATIAGPANIVVQGLGMSLSSGRAWISCRTGFSLGLPDRNQAVVLTAGTRMAVDARSTIHANRGVLAVAQGQAHQEGLDLVAGWAIGRGRKPYRWRWARPTAGRISLAGDDAADEWDFSCHVAWKDLGDEAVFTLADHQGPGQAVLDIRPGIITVVIDGVERQRIDLAGAPLRGPDLAIERDGETIEARIGGYAIPLPDAQGLSLTWNLHGGATVLDPVFHTGPDQAPPLPVPASFLWTAHP